MQEAPNKKELMGNVKNAEALNLNPEILEKIMSKVQDINKSGIAFHTTSGYNPEHLLDNIKSLLKDGLLGRGSSNSTNPSAWAKGVRKNKIAEIYFNITGRFRSVIYEDDGKGGEFEKVLPSTIGNNVWGSKQGVTILFNAKTFKEVKPPEGNEAEMNSQLPVHSFTPNSNNSSSMGVNEEGKTIVHPQLGFQLKARVAPRFFTGIVLGTDRGYDSPMSREEFQKKADAVIKVMLEADASKSERLLPVYDIQGNIIWPEKITYENVKKLIEQRDTHV